MFAILKPDRHALWLPYAISLLLAVGIVAVVGRRWHAGKSQVPGRRVKVAAVQFISAFGQPPGP
jgi:hypothetical protein